MVRRIVVQNRKRCRYGFLRVHKEIAILNLFRTIQAKANQKAMFWQKSCTTFERIAMARR